MKNSVYLHKAHSLDFVSFCSTYTSTSLSFSMKLLLFHFPSPTISLFMNATVIFQLTHFLFLESQSSMCPWDGHIAISSQAKGF